MNLIKDSRATARLLVAVTALTLCVPALGAQRERDQFTGGGHVLYAAGGGRVSCRNASAVETELMQTRDAESLHVIKPGRLGKLADEQGLTIVLRGTQQLESFPLAKQAFITAAARWEAIVGSPVTIVLDVDFGPTRFGTPYPQFVIGSTDPQYPGSSRAISYTSMRQRLIDRATPSRKALYDMLPVGSTVPTTEGSASLVYIPTAVMRALGFLPATANPDTEAFLGDPPSIGFNSAFSYDFDPSNGIDNGKTDFDAVVTHEIGHALGFDSWSGLRELAPTAPVLLTTWDLFRFRPGVTAGSFSTAQRVTVSTGAATYFAGGQSLSLSTGRPDGSGGDGRQASHWKDDVLNNNRYIGIMDPTIDDGVREEITANDVEALGFIGYQIGHSPAAATLEAEVEGDTVTFTGTITDVDGDLDIQSARFDVLDSDDEMVGTLTTVNLSSTGDGSAATFTATTSGLGQITGAYYGRLTVSDEAGNTAELTVDLGLPDPGGPTVSNAVFKRNKLKLTGTGFAATLQLEVNGQIRSVTIKTNKAKTKIKIKADAGTLGLVSGENTIRVLSNGLRSNLFRFQQ